MKNPLRCVPKRMSILIKEKTSLHLIKKELHISIKAFMVFCFLLSSMSFDLMAQEMPSDLERYGSVEIKLMGSRRQFKKAVELKGVYIDHGCRHHELKLIVTEQGYKNLLAGGFEFEIVKQETGNLICREYDEIINLKNGSNCMPVMDFYPSYEAYEEMMYAFEEQYPDLCKIINIGTLASGRKLLVAQLGDQSDTLEMEPGFFYTATMHGDELIGYPLMLMLIDHLLCNYGSDERLTDLMNDVNIFINPLANPDGTYRGGNNTVENSMRWNNRFVDLNRNFPDPKAGDHPDDEDYQEETIYFMDFARQNKIHLSCNIHSGRRGGELSMGYFSGYSC